MQDKIYILSLPEPTGPEPRSKDNPPAQLTSIYGKIQVSSRSAATRYAVDHTLV